MSRHDDAVSLAHMHHHAREAVEACGERRRADLDSDRLFNLAMVRLVEIIGEAANRVTQTKRDQLASIP